MMVKAAFLLLLTGALFLSPRAQGQINPTGTYTKGGGIARKETDRKGYYGEIRVKRLDAKRIAVAFWVSSGPPGYNSGSFVDTLPFSGSVVVYQPQALDSTCNIRFRFTKTSLIIQQQSKASPSECGFGWGVITAGTFKKTSARIPKIIDLARGEE